MAGTREVGGKGCLSHGVVQSHPRYLQSLDTMRQCVGEAGWSAYEYDGSRQGEPTRDLHREEERNTQAGRNVPGQILLPAVDQSRKEPELAAGSLLVNEWPLRQGRSMQQGYSHAGSSIQA